MKSCAGLPPRVVLLLPSWPSPVFSLPDCPPDTAAAAPGAQASFSPPTPASGMTCTPGCQANRPLLSLCSRWHPQRKIGAHSPVALNTEGARSLLAGETSLLALPALHSQVLGLQGASRQGQMTTGWGLSFASCVASAAAAWQKELGQAPPPPGNLVGLQSALVQHPLCSS